MNKLLSFTLLIFTIISFSYKVVYYKANLFGADVMREFAQSPLQRDARFGYGRELLVEEQKLVSAHGCG